MYDYFLLIQKVKRKKKIEFTRIKITIRKNHIIVVLRL
jgi:hypothetical protein